MSRRPTVLSQLIDLYAEQGLQVITGLNPAHFGGYSKVAGTRLIRDGRLSPGAGTPLQDVFCIEHLFADYHPRHVLIIGNSFGWSSFLLALLLPEARIVGLDTGYDEDSRFGLAVTRQIAAARGLNVVAVQGASPEAAPGAVAEHLDGWVDFAFIDGEHSNEAIIRDFAVVRELARPETVYLFDDVLSGMRDGFEHNAAAAPELRSVVLYGTETGMALLHPPDSPVGDAARPFTIPPEIAQQLLGRQLSSKRSAGDKLRRSVSKRAAWMRRLLGGS